MMLFKKNILGVFTIYMLARELSFFLGSSLKGRGGWLVSRSFVVIIRMCENVTRPRSLYESIKVFFAVATTLQALYSTIHLIIIQSPRWFVKDFFFCLPETPKWSTDLRINSQSVSRLKLHSHVFSPSQQFTIIMCRLSNTLVRHNNHIKLWIELEFSVEFLTIPT